MLSLNYYLNPSTVGTVSFLASWKLRNIFKKIWTKLSTLSIFSSTQNFLVSEPSLSLIFLCCCVGRFFPWNFNSTALCSSEVYELISLVVNLKVCLLTISSFLSWKILDKVFHRWFRHPDGQLYWIAPVASYGPFRRRNRLGCFPPQIFMTSRVYQSTTCIVVSAPLLAVVRSAVIQTTGSYARRLASKSSSSGLSAHLLSARTTSRLGREVPTPSPAQDTQQSTRRVTPHVTHLPIQVYVESLVSGPRLVVPHPNSSRNLPILARLGRA